MPGPDVKLFHGVAYVPLSDYNALKLEMLKNRPKPSAISVPGDVIEVIDQIAALLLDAGYDPDVEVNDFRDNAVVQAIHNMTTVGPQGWDLILESIRRQHA